MKCGVKCLGAVIKGRFLLCMWLSHRVTQIAVLTRHAHAYQPTLGLSKRQALPDSIAKGDELVLWGRSSWDFAIHRPPRA